MEVTSNTPTTTGDHLLLNCLHRHVQDLSTELNLLLQKEESLSQGKSVGKKLGKVRRSKHTVAAQIDALRKVFLEVEEISSALHSCNGHRSFNSELVSHLELSSSTSGNQTKEGSSTSVSQTEVTTNLEPGALDEDKPRYLCLSDGLVICYLDLERTKYQPYNNKGEVPPLPKVSTLKLLQQGLPVSAGLFKLGPDAYMIGGQELPGYPDPLNVRWSGGDPWGIDLYKFLSSEHGIKGSSRVIYRLSLADKTLILSRCNIRELMKPKVWPIVEKIDGKIHVIDSVPSEFSDCHLTGPFSHEVLSLDNLGKGWTKIPINGALGERQDIRSHLVLGDRIYAPVTRDRLLVFDSKTKKWEGHRYDGKAYNPFQIEHAWQILRYGNGRCVGESFPFGNDRLFVVIAVVQVSPNCEDTVRLVAYIVNSTGKILGNQDVAGVFADSPRPYKLIQSTVIDVDEQGKTMCALANTNVCDLRFEGEYLFISRFTVEVLADVRPKLRKILAERGDSMMVIPDELEIVRVVVKDRHVYKADTDLKEDGDFTSFARIQACFI